MIIHPDMVKPIHATTSVAPIPTVIPNPIIHVHAGDTGHKTLWFVVSVMVDFASAL